MCSDRRKKSPEPFLVLTSSLFSVMPKYFDLNVHTFPETDTAVEELVRVAKRYGYAGLALTNHDDAVVYEYSDSKTVFTGVEIRAQSIVELKRKIQLYWGNVAVVAVHGGNEKINRAAVENPKVDILAHPSGERGEGGLNHVLVRYAAENGVAIDFNMHALIHSRRGDRARIIGKMRENLKLVRKYAAPVIVTSHARSVYDLRAPREMIALATLFGMTNEEATRALSETPAGVLEKRWKKERDVEVLEPKI
jgi:ribonuclease P/MRP protein subunit RPP1